MTMLSMRLLCKEMLTPVAYVIMDALGEHLLSTAPASLCTRANGTHIAVRQIGWNIAQGIAAGALPSLSGLPEEEYFMPFLLLMVTNHDPTLRRSFAKYVFDSLIHAESKAVPVVALWPKGIFRTLNLWTDFEAPVVILSATHRANSRRTFSQSSFKSSDCLEDGWIPTPEEGNSLNLPLSPGIGPASFGDSEDNQSCVGAPMLPSSGSAMLLGADGQMLQDQRAPLIHVKKGSVSDAATCFGRQYYILASRSDVRSSDLVVDIATVKSLTYGTDAELIENDDAAETSSGDIPVEDKSPDGKPRGESPPNNFSFTSGANSALPMTRTNSSILARPFVPPYAVSVPGGVAQMQQHAELLKVVFRRPKDAPPLNYCEARGAEQLVLYNDNLEEAIKLVPPGCRAVTLYGEAGAPPEAGKYSLAPKSDGDNITLDTPANIKHLTFCVIPKLKSVCFRYCKLSSIALCDLAGFEDAFMCADALRAMRVIHTFNLPPTSSIQIATAPLSSAAEAAKDHMSNEIQLDADGWDALRAPWSF